MVLNLKREININKTFLQYIELLIPGVVLTFITFPLMVFAVIVVLGGGWEGYPVKVQWTPQLFLFELFFWFSAFGVMARILSLDYF